MSAPQEPAAKPKILPILDYILRTYLSNAKIPQGDEVANSHQLVSEMAALKGKRDAIIEYKRKLSPYKRHILESYSDLGKINAELIPALVANNAEEITRGYFRVTALLIRLKTYRDGNLPIEKLDSDLVFTEIEKQFLDKMIGLDIPFNKTYSAPPPPIVTRRVSDVDKRQLIRNNEVVDEDYEEPLRLQIRDYIVKNFGIERVADFSGTKKPYGPGEIVKNVKVKEEVDDMTCFRTPSQFLEQKYRSLRRSTYRPLDIERKETGGYRQKRIKFKEQNGQIVVVDSGMISAEMHFMDPGTISKKLIGDIGLLSQTLTMGAKKINNDYFFNVFYHIQHAVGAPGDEPTEENAEPTQTKFERFEPSMASEPGKKRDRISAEKTMELITEFSKYDKFIFGGHLDLDVYLDSIGIRKKPNIIMYEGEGLACYEYINNLIIVPTICPPRITPLDQIVSALADFRYALWVDSPKNIFDQQGVGFQIVGAKKKAMSKKPLWAIFPLHCSALIKQRAFREYYRRHVLSNLVTSGIKSVAGYPIPMVNRITETALRQFFTAYVPLSVKGGGDTGEAPTEEAVGAPAMAEQDTFEAEDQHFDEPAVQTAPPAPAAKKPAPAPEPAPAAAPKVEEDEFFLFDESEPEAPAAPAPPKAAPVAAKPAAAPPPPPKPRPAPPAPPAAAAGQTACKKCGKPLPPGSKFCLNCGSPVITSVKCANCGVELPAGSKFCNECGAPQA